MSKVFSALFRVIGILLAIIVVAYLCVGFYMKDRFFPNTTINGIDVSLLGDREAINKLVGTSEGYELMVLDCFGRKEVFTKEDMGFSIGDMERVTNLRFMQNPALWIESLYNVYDYEDAHLFTVDTNKILATLKDRDIFKYPGGSKSEDAYIGFDSEKSEFVIVPEVYGTIIDPVELSAIIAEHAVALDGIVDTKTDGGYVLPKIYKNDEKLNHDIKIFNDYSKASVKYDMKGAEEYVGPETYVDWLVANDNRVFVDQNKVKAFVKAMADKYDTFGTERKFKTSWGDTITLKTKEEYGWEIDQEKEAAQLTSDILSNKAVVRDFNYLNEAESHGNTDLGDTYIEVNFTKQHLYLYKEGKVVLDTDVVTGNTGRGMGTPTGIYHIYNKAKNRYLVGETYRSWVYYWMPFYKAYGLHDATWRKAFGGEIYKRSGSHGCINLPLEVAGELYDNIDVGYLVITYYEE